MTIGVARLAGALVLGCLLGCAADPGVGLPSDVRNLQAQTTPPGARLISVSPITQNDWSVAATWDVEATIPWEEYRRRVSERLFGFQQERANGDHLTLSRTLAGDTYTVRIEVVTVGPPLHVRVRFQSAAS